MIDPVGELNRLQAEARRQGDPLAEFAALATLDEAGWPSTRMLTLRSIGPTGVAFHVNGESPKANHLRTNGRSEVLFFWPTSLVQVRLRGKPGLMHDEEARSAWHIKSAASKAADILHATSLPQSTVVEGRAELMGKYAQAAAEMARATTPPPHVSTLRLMPEFLEIWIGSPKDRMHNRCRYSRVDDVWTSETLVP